MTGISRFHLSLLLGIVALAAPATAQPAARVWNPGPESVVVNGTAFMSFRGILTGSHIGQAIAVSAHVAVPYGDLNLTSAPGVDEFGRRIHVAARLVCDQLDRKYPVSLYPVLDGSTGEDCVRASAAEGMVAANQVIASKQQR